MDRLRGKDYIIQPITHEGGQGLIKDLFNAPVQVCQFHMIAIVMRKLRKKHQSQASKKLKIIAKILLESSKMNFIFENHAEIKIERTKIDLRDYLSILSTN